MNFHPLYEGGSAASGFIARMMYENSLKHNKKYGYEVKPKHPDSTMKEWADFDYKKIANASQAGVNKAGKNRWGQDKTAEYGASPFIQRYFKNTQGKPPVPWKRGDVEKEDKGQRNARKKAMKAYAIKLFNDAKKRVLAVSTPAEAERIEAEEAPKNEIVQLAPPPEGIEVKPKEAEKEKVAEKAPSPTPPKEEEKKKVLSAFVDEDDIDEWLNEDENDEFGDSNAGQIRAGLFKYLYSNPKKIQLADAIKYVKENTDVEKGLSSANVSPLLAKAKELYKEKLELEIEKDEEETERQKKEEEEKALKLKNRRPLYDHKLERIAIDNNFKEKEDEYAFSIFTSPPPKEWKYLTIYDPKDYEVDGVIYFNYVWIDPYTGENINNVSYDGDVIFSKKYPNLEFGYKRDNGRGEFVPVEELDTKEAIEDRKKLTDEVKAQIYRARPKTDEELIEIVKEREGWTDKEFGDMRIFTPKNGDKYFLYTDITGKYGNKEYFVKIDPISGDDLDKAGEKRPDGYWYFNDGYDRFRERNTDLDEMKEKPKEKEKKTYKYTLEDIPKGQKERLKFAKELNKEKGFNYKPRDDTSAGTLRHQIIERLRKLGLMASGYAEMMAENDKEKKKGKGFSDFPEMCGI